MNRSLLWSLTAGAALALAGSATGAVVTTLDVTFPATGNQDSQELIGPRSVLTVEVPAGLNAQGIESTTFIGRLVALGSDGLALPAAAVPTFAIPNAAFNAGDYANVAITKVITLTNVAIDQTALGNFLGQAGLRFVRVEVSTTGNDFAVDAVVTLTDTANETNNETPLVDVTPPAISGVFLNSAGTTAFVQFSERINSTVAGNDANHTVLANVDATDLQVSTSSTFAAPLNNPTGLTFPGAFAANETIISAARAATGANPVNNGTFVRGAYGVDGTTPDVNLSIRDLAGNRLSAASIAAATAQAFAIEFVREPDLHIGYLHGGWLTMGHVLSTPMVAAGLAILVLARARTLR